MSRVSMAVPLFSAVMPHVGKSPTWAGRSLSLWLTLAMLAMIVEGCAGTSGSARPLTALAKDESLSRYTRLSFSTSAVAGVSGMTADDRERIIALVVRKLKERAPTRFATVEGAATDPGTLQVSVDFKRYDEGNAAARFMLAGLGQIHIDADVTLEDRARAAILAKYEVTKTFAWGGIYGASTTIRDVEDGFAEAVAKVVLGEGDQ